MRAFTTHTAAVALDLNWKWVDNLLSQNDIEGCSRVRQGVGRRLTQRGILHVAVIADLTRSLRIPVRLACDVARALIGPPAAEGDMGARQGATHLAMTSTLALRLDLSALDRSLAPRLALAVEPARRPRRGRPRATLPRGTP